MAAASVPWLEFSLMAVFGAAFLGLIAGPCPRPGPWRVAHDVAIALTAGLSAMFAIAGGIAGERVDLVKDADARMWTAITGLVGAAIVAFVRRL